MLRRRATLARFAIIAALAGCRGERGPRVEPYVVAVIAQEPALTAGEIEASVAIPVESALRNIRSVTSLRTESRTGVTTVVAELSDEAGQGEARPQLEAIRTQLPASVMPVIQLVAPDAPDDLVLDVRGTHPSLVLTRIAHDWIRPRIERIAGAGAVHVRGGQERRLELRLDPARLDAMDVTVLEVTSALANPLDLPSGRVGADRVRGGAVRGGVDEVWPELRDRVVVTRGGSPVRVADVATIAEALDPAQPEPLQIGIRFLRGTDRAGVAKAIAEAIRTDLPEGVTIDKARPAPRPPRVTLIADDPAALAEAADRVARELGIEVARTPTVELHVDRERAAALGISSSEVGSVIAAVHGRPVAEASDWTDIVMRLEGVDPARVVDVLRIRGAQGTLVPLSAVVTRREGFDEPVRLRIDRRPAMELTVPRGNAADLQRRVAKLGLPAQIRVRVQ